MKSKLIFPAVVGFTLILVAAFIWAVYSSMGAFEPEGSPNNKMPNLSDVKNATNVETFRVDGGNEIMVFDIQRDGQTLTCTSKRGYDSGVACTKK